MDLLPRALILTLLSSAVWSEAPVVTVEPKVVTVRQGESVSFRCQVGSASPSNVVWRKTNSQRLPDNVKISPDNLLLTLVNVRPQNQGQYRCVAGVPRDRAFATATLNVKFPPKVQLNPAGPIRVRIGDPLSVECSTMGRPRPKLTWKRQGSTLQLVTTTTSDVNTIQWPAVRPEDSGVYLCRAENTEGMSEVKVEIIVEGGPGVPIASVSATQVTAIEGHTITMQCQATGSPTPEITWSKLRAPLPWKHTVAGGVLTLNNVGRQDSGQYICNATNRHGYSEAYTEMEVEAPPYATCLPDQVKLKPGDALQLQCLAHGTHPITFQWSVSGRSSLPAGAETTWDGKLLIPRIKVSDSGTYTCAATNHIGSSTATGRVTVKG
ncbi:basement membrane-specific heparan sulfate proteoglycan core protein-like [Eucyclogobius newberryi]|uniref:basement membrane-specific heparan sulfate proteoglycan core protein-like n=1 Tax=Eucyclogobius newberryi TaxID=166745 RepID=UPI003B5CFC2F